MQHVMRKDLAESLLKVLFMYPIGNLKLLTLSNRLPHTAVALSLPLSHTYTHAFFYLILLPLFITSLACVVGFRWTAMNPRVHPTRYSVVPAVSCTLLCSQKAAATFYYYYRHTHTFHHTTNKLHSIVQLCVVGAQI